MKLRATSNKSLEMGSNATSSNGVNHRFGVRGLALAGLLILTGTCGAEARLSEWFGCARSDFEVDGRDCIEVNPKSAAPGKPWIWRARFFGHEPQTDQALLDKGFHLVFMDVGDWFGSPRAVAHWDAFYIYLTESHGLSKKVALEGMSRGGLIVYNWAKANPEKVACIYADAPVCDIRSWPGGKGAGAGSPKSWETCKAVHGLTEEQAVDFTGNPVDGLEALARAGVPLLHICGAADKVVPMAENTDVLKKRYEALGGSIRVISKPGVGHHPHSLKDPSVIVDFILKHTVGDTEPKDLGAIWFVGDSITQSNADEDPNGSPRKALYDLLIAQGYTFNYTGHWKGNVDGLPTTGTSVSENLYHYHSGCSGAVIQEPLENRVGITQSLPHFWDTGRLTEVKPKVILIMLGSNDIHLGLNCEAAPDRMRGLLDTLYELPDLGNPTVLLGSIPPSKGWKGDNVIAFNATLPGIVAEYQARGRDIRFVDHFKALNNKYSSNMRSDNLHPNAAGNQVIAREWFKVLTAPDRDMLNP
jgi:pimeloyl-ACP methyl ester carboxylesterase